MEPLIVGLGARHVSVADAIVLGGVASDGDRVGGDNDGGMSVVVRAGAGVVDEDITGLDVAGGSSLVAAGAGPAVSRGEAVTKVLGADLLLAAGVASAGGTARKAGVATSDEALGDEVGAVTTVAGVTADLATPVGVGGAGSVGAALVVGSGPVGAGVVHGSVSVVGEGSCDESNEDTDSFKHDED